MSHCHWISPQKGNIVQLRGLRPFRGRLFAIVPRSWYLRKSSASPAPPFQDAAEFGWTLRLLFRWWFPSLQGGKIALSKSSSRSPAINALQYVPEGNPSSLCLKIDVSANSMEGFYYLTRNHQRRALPPGSHFPLFRTHLHFHPRRCPPHQETYEPSLSTYRSPTLPFACHFASSISHERAGYLPDLRSMYKPESSAHDFSIPLQRYSLPWAKAIFLLLHRIEMGYKGRKWSHEDKKKGQTNDNNKRPTSLIQISWSSDQLDWAMANCSWAYWSCCSSWAVHTKWSGWWLLDAGGMSSEYCGTSEKEIDRRAICEAYDGKAARVWSADGASMDGRFEGKICHADSETWDWEMLINVGEWQGISRSAVTIDFARQGSRQETLGRENSIGC